MFDSVFLALFVQGADCLDSPILGKHTKRLPQPMPLSNVVVVEVSCTTMSSYFLKECRLHEDCHQTWSQIGKNYDFTCGINLFQAFRSQALVAYLHEHRMTHGKLPWMLAVSRSINRKLHWSQMTRDTLPL